MESSIRPQLKTGVTRSPLCTMSMNVLRGLLLAAGNKDARRDLNGIPFEPTEKVLIASNGKVFLLVAQTFSRRCKPFTVSREACERALGLPSEALPGIAVSLSAPASGGLRNITFAGARGSVTDREMDDLVGEEGPTSPSASGDTPVRSITDQLTQLRTAMRLVTGDKTLMVQAVKRGRLPILVVCRYRSVLGIVMPCTPDEDPSPWLRAARALENEVAERASGVTTTEDSES